MNNFLKVENIYYSYGKNTVINNVSLDVREGALLFVMGSNGAGKTTLLNCLLNNIQVKQGHIFYSGKDINSFARDEFSKLVAYVPQNFNLNCEFKVKDYLVLGRNPYVKLGNPTKIDYEIVEKYSIAMGIGDILGKQVKALSGGQRQWIAISRALIQETPILIMDEPMSALDLGKQAELLILLKKINSQGKTIILTSHNPNHSLAVLSADVCLLHNGEIKALGNSKSVFSIENIKEIYGEHVALDSNGRLCLLI